MYILGLKEATEKTRTVIQIDSSIKNSFADQVFHKYTVDKELPGEEATERTFELIIIWLNRLLFIKLFEGQLISFNSDDACYHILDNDKIKDSQNLQHLFFDVLGRKVRSEESFYKQFLEVPYLNSSLFERQRIELLKNAYYKNGIMETLPNIDINIKCGNSLISRMSFEPSKKIGAKNADLDKSSKGLIRDYKQQESVIRQSRIREKSSR